MNRMVSAALFMVFLLAGAAWAAEARIAVTAEGAGADSRVSGIAARAPYILLFDAGGKLVSAHPNPVAASPGGAGPALARWLADKQVTLLVSGNAGDNLARELERLKIRSARGSGPADQAVRAVAK
jgi:predicted Fe-Mo cluster-binding NifX family protein